LRCIGGENLKTKPYRLNGGVMFIEDRDIIENSTNNIIGSSHDGHNIRVKHIHRICPLCGTDNKERPALLFSEDAWLLKKCAKCSFVYLENPPHYEKFEDEFAWEKTSEKKLRTKNKSSLSLLFGKVVKKLRRDKLSVLINQYCRSGNVLDIGCGEGKILSRLNEKYTPYGIEISRALAQKAHHYFVLRGGMVIQKDALSGLSEFAGNYFEAVIMSAYLEHELFPKEILRETVRVLKPAGCLIIKVPNFGSVNRLIKDKKWCGFRFPCHVNYYTPATLQKALKEAGLQLARFNFFDRLPTSDNMWTIATKPASRL